MKHELSQISLLLKEALAIAKTFDHFDGAIVSLSLSCFDGSTASVTESLGNTSNDTDKFGSTITQASPKRSLPDQLGDIKKNTWL